MKRFKNGFHIVVRDNDKKQFHVSGIMYSDKDINKRVLAAQRAGRDVICYSSESDRDTVIINFKKNNPNFSLSDEPLV